jgi:hypothetical protein
MSLNDFNCGSWRDASRVHGETAAKTVVLASACECASLAFDGEPPSQTGRDARLSTGVEGPGFVCSLAYSVFGIVLLHNGE